MRDVDTPLCREIRELGSAFRWEDTESALRYASCVAPCVVSVRTCIGCFKKSPQNELIRIVRLPNKEVVLDRSTLSGSDEKGPRPAGRSVYLCRDLACFTKAAKTHKNKNAFKGRLHVPVGAEMLEILRKELSPQ